MNLFGGDTDGGSFPELLLESLRVLEKSGHSGLEIGPKIEQEDRSPAYW